MNQPQQPAVFPVREDEIEFLFQKINDIRAQFSQVEPIVLTLRRVLQRTPVEIVQQDEKKE